MTFEERNNLVGILCGAIMITVYVWRITALHGAGVFDGHDGLMLWARETLWLIGYGIGLVIVATILFSIFYAIVTNDPKPNMVVDERDRMISIWGQRVTIAVMSVFFVAALFALAFGWSAFAVFNIMLAGFAFGDMAGNLTKLGLYRFWA